MTVNNFLENELKKIFGNDDMFSNTKYVSGSCYGELDNDLKVKCRITDSSVYQDYDTVEISIINRKEGVVEAHSIKFVDIWGRFPVPNNPNFPDGIVPHIWVYNGKTEWYSPIPKDNQYMMLRKCIRDYLDIFRDNRLEREQKPSIKKQLADKKKTQSRKIVKSKQNDLEV